MQNDAVTGKLYLTIAEVCERLNLSRKTVVKFLGQDLAMCRFGRSIRIPVTALEYFEDTRCER